MALSFIGSNNRCDDDESGAPEEGGKDAAPLC
jgi:hypothetical protein